MSADGQRQSEQQQEQQQQNDQQPPAAFHSTSTRHPHLQPHLQPARGNSLFEELQWAPALKEALPSAAGGSNLRQTMDSRQSSLDVLNNYNQAQAALGSTVSTAATPFLPAAALDPSQPQQHDYQYQTIINAAPEPLNAANLASAAYQPAQSQLYSQWGFVHNPSYPGPQQPWFNAAAQPEQQQPLRAYTPSYTSRSSMDGSVLPSSPMPMHHQQPHYQSHSPSQQQQQQQHQQHQGWRDTAQDDGLSLYSASSISRPSTPSNYQSFYNSPSLMPSDDPNSPLPKPQDGLLTAARPDAGAQHQQLQHQQHLLEDPASHQLTSLGPPVADRHATIQPGFAPYPGPPSRDTTMGFGGGSSSASPQPASHEASSVAPPPTVSFLGQDFSTSPTASPKASAMHDFSSSHPVDPSEQGGPAQQTPYLMPQPSKTNSLSRLDIPMAPSIEFEAATATAGPGTARPNGQTSTQLDRMIAQSRGEESHQDDDQAARLLQQMPNTSYAETHPAAGNGVQYSAPQSTLFPLAQRPQQEQQQQQQQQFLGAPPAAHGWPQHQHQQPRRSRSHSDTDISFLATHQPLPVPVPGPSQQPWSGHQLAPQKYASSSSGHSRSASPFNQSASPLQHQQSPSPLPPAPHNQTDGAFLAFGNPRESLIGPRRSSNASDLGRPQGPYAHETSHRATSAEPFSFPGHAIPRADFQLQQQQQAFVRGHGRMAQSEDLTHSMPFFSTSGPTFRPSPAEMAYTSAPSFQPLAGASLFGDGTSGLFPPTDSDNSSNNHSLHASPHLSQPDCPSPALSGSSSSQHYFDASQQQLFMPPPFRDGSIPPILDPDFHSDPVHLSSQTTNATKEAAARRRKPGTEAKYSCQYCGETFTRNYNLRGHMRAHNGAKPYKCSEPGCLKAFARSHDLRRHADLHTTVSKYKCHSCERAFKRLDALQRHHRSEAGQSCAKTLLEAGVIDPKMNGMMRTSVRL